MAGVAKIVDLLPTGKENAISQKQLAAVLNISERELRKRIEFERRNGAVICSSTDADGSGYYLPQNVEEAQRFYATMQKRTRPTLECLRATRRWIKAAGMQAEEKQEK